MEEMVAELIYHRNITLDQIAELTDAQIVHLYCAPRDKSGQLIRKKDRRKLDFTPPPPVEDHQVAPEILEQMRQLCHRKGSSEPVPESYMSMFIQVWKARQLDDAGILERWANHLASGN